MAYGEYNTSRTFRDVLGHTNITVGSDDSAGGSTITNTIQRDGVKYRAVGTSGQGTTHISRGVRVLYEKAPEPWSPYTAPKRDNRMR